MTYYSQVGIRKIPPTLKDSTKKREKKNNDKINFEK
jgi:hypothetical protein